MKYNDFLFDWNFTIDLFDFFIPNEFSNNLKKLNEHILTIIKEYVWMCFSKNQKCHPHDFSKYLWRCRFEDGNFKKLCTNL